MCIDFQAVQHHDEAKVFPIPGADDLLDRLHGSAIYFHLISLKQFCIFQNIQTAPTI